MSYWGEPKPWTIIFFPSGVAAVCDQYGKQMPKYQVGKHADTIAALAADGYDWRNVREIYGYSKEFQDVKWRRDETDHAHRR